jgi:carboxypeptidase C (cathepsin A)
MKLTITITFLLFTLFTTAQDKQIMVDETVKTTHQTTIKGVTFSYEAITGTQPVWDENGKPIAAVHYTYYQRQDVQELGQRPLVISFNGGPGSGSVWMHLAYTGPVILNIDDEGFPVQPYGVRKNPYSILDVADIVFVNPVNTGYSRILDEEVDKKTFFGVEADIKYLAEWINTFVTRMNRWTSPKYLIGESYGTTRVSGLALALQQQQWMYLNGVVLVSPTELGIERDGPVTYATRLPYFTAAAWYHQKLPPDLQSKDLEEILPEVEQFSMETLLPVLAKGGTISLEEKQATAQMMARYSGIATSKILSHNLRVPNSYFWKDLLRNEGFTIGRLDSRYKGIDTKTAGERPEFNSEITSWLHSFTPAINYYYRNDLNFITDIKYNMFGPVRPWDRSNNNTGRDLQMAMNMNPYLKVMVQSGYYDGATQYFDAKYTLWHLDHSGKLADRLSFKGYRSGHMMYLRREDLKQANEDLRVFIKNSLPKEGEPAKYD